MSYNGSGTFTINSTGQPVVAGTVITASAFNALTTDLATGLTTAITKDGQTTTTARITFAQGLTSSLTTDSSSVSTGSIITAGGMGVAKNLYVGGLLDVAGATSFTNPVINNIKMGYTTTATAAGTTTLTVSSNYRQFFTGTLAQTIVLPVTSTLVTGIAYEIENNSTGTLTVNSSGGNLVGTVPAGVCAHAVCIGTTLTTAADWDWDYISTTTITGTGANVLGTSPTITTATLASPNITTALTLTGASGTSGQLLTSAGSGSAPTWTTVSADTVGFKNRIINGGMAIAQRGTTSTSTGYQTVDRWQVNNGTNQAQVTDAPSGFSNSLEITGTVAGSSGYGLVNQYIESKNVLGLLGNNCTLSAWVKNTGTSTANVSLEVYYANTTDNFSAVTLISSPTSQAITTGWTRITFPVIAVPSAASTGIAIRLFRYDGSNSQKWEITGVQFELGSTATSFDYRPYGTELALCQRYYYLHGSGSDQSIGDGSLFSATILMLNINFPVNMRTAPTLVQTTGTNYYRFWRNATNDDFNDFTYIFSASTRCAALQAESNISGTSGWGGRTITNNASASIAFNSEL
jgi:hypothetical protein